MEELPEKLPTQYLNIFAVYAAFHRLLVNINALQQGNNCCINSENNRGANDRRRD